MTVLTPAAWERWLESELTLLARRPRP